MDLTNSPDVAQDIETVETWVETTAAEPEVQEWLPAQEPEPENKWQSKAAKLLAQRNEARKEADELAARLEKLEWRFESEDTAKAEATKNDFKASYWDEALGKAEEVLNQHPSLSLEQAYQLAWGTLQKNPTRFSTPWRAPAALRTEKSVAEMSTADLRAQADAELNAMLWR